MLTDRETGEWVIAVIGGFEVERFLRSQGEVFWGLGRKPRQEEFLQRDRGRFFKK